MKAESYFYRWQEFNRWQKMVAILFFVVYFLIRLQFRLTSHLLNDEQVTFGGMHLPFWEWFTVYVPRNDYHFPTSYLPLYPFGHWISKDPWAMSIPYALLSLFFYWAFLRLKWTKLLNLDQANARFGFLWINVFATILMTYNATLIEHAFIIRPYAFLGLLAIWAFIVSNELLTIKTFSFRYALVTAAVILIHNFGLLMMTTFLFYHLVRHLIFSQDRTMAGSIQKSWLPIASTIFVGCLLAFPLWFYFTQAPTIKALDRSLIYDPAVHKKVHEYIKPGARGVFQVVATYYGFKPFRWLIFSLACLGTFRLLVRQQWAVLVFPVVTIFGPTVAMYWFALYSKYWFIQRTFIWVMPLHAVFVSICVFACLTWPLERIQSPSIRKMSHV